jgi:hypothetical protein
MQGRMGEISLTSLTFYVHSYLNQVNVSILSIYKEKMSESYQSTCTRVFGRLGSYGSSKYGKCVHNTEVGFSAFGFNEALRSVGTNLLFLMSLYGSSKKAKTRARSAL